MKKKIYHLYFKEGCDTGGYDSFDSHLVIAETEEEARSYCPCGDECRSSSYGKRDNHLCVWRDSSKTYCEHIGDAKSQVSGVVISSFNAG
jgi:hypothetical protein